MAWLTSLRKKPGPEALLEVAEQPGEESLPPVMVRGPFLTVLEPDIAGISSFRFRQFPSAEPAEEHIAGLSPDVRRGTHAFWALHERPQGRDDVHVEALVLIRAEDNSDLVYVVSFLDLDSALSFTRFEVRRGLVLTNVMIYWAAFVQVSEEIGGVTVTPGSAPTTFASAPAGQESPASPGQQPSTVEVQAVAAVQRYLEHVDEETSPQPVVEDSTALADPPTVHEKRSVPTPPPPAETMHEETPAISEPPAIDQIPALAAADAVPEILIAEPVLAPEEVVESFQVEEAVLDEAYVLRHELPSRPESALDSPAQAPAVESSLALDETRVIAASTVVTEPQAINAVDITEHVAAQAELAQAQPPAIPNASEIMAAEAGMLVDATASVSGPTLSFPGDEEVLDSVVAIPEQSSTETEGTTSIEAEATVDATIDVPQVKRYNDFDVAWEVERLLRNRRWREKGDEPFSGFKSPPGRF